MRKHLTKYFIPHESNDYAPHFLREMSVLFMVAIIVFAFLVASIQVIIITKTDLIGAIFPSVLVDLANKDRVEAGMKNLSLSPVLTEAAKLKANDMAEKGYFAHTSPEGLTPWHWFRLVDYDFMVAGENLAVDFSDSGDVERAWMNSPSHRANILKNEFTEIGIATAEGFYNGKRTTFVVQMFGKPTPRFDGPVVSGDSEIDMSFASENSITLSLPEEETNLSGTALGEENYASFFEELLLSPKKTLAIIYFGLGSMVVLAIVLLIGVEIGRQHPKHMVYGLMLLVLIFTLFYLYREVIVSEVLVV